MDMFNMSLTYNDAEVVRNAVNQGIDSRLEGFTRSQFQWSDDTGIPRLECQVDDSELQVLIRRLLESGDPDAEMLADNIIYVQYDYEVI